MTTNTEPACDCSEEYGPCELHGTVLAQRDGAASRTADELALVLIGDLVDLGEAELSPYGADVVARVRAALDSDHDRGNWLDSDELRDELYSVADQVESSAGDVWVIHDDGYRIVRPSADCPLLAI